jgi:hypothetical protein
MTVMAAQLPLDTRTPHHQMNITRLIATVITTKYGTKIVTQMHQRVVQQLMALSIRTVLQPWNVPNRHRRQLMINEKLLQFPLI